MHPAATVTRRVKYVVIKHFVRSVIPLTKDSGARYTLAVTKVGNSVAGKVDTIIGGGVKLTRVTMSCG